MIQTQTIHCQTAPHRESFTDALALHVLSEIQQQAADFNQVCIFIPNVQAVQQMRQSLVNISQQALLGGYIGSLPEWLSHNIMPAELTKTHLCPAARQLLLLEALNQHAELFQTDNHWQVCDSLLELFDELNLSCHDWLNEPTPVWIKKLSEAYQTQNNVDQLNQEAKIIQTLWVAWQQQLEALNYQDDTGCHKQRLLVEIPNYLKNKHFFIVGLEQLSPLEQAWCEQLSQTCRVTRISQQTASENTPKKKIDKENSYPDIDLLDDIFSQKRSFYQRIQNHKHSFGFLNNIKCFDAHSSEQETQAVDLKVRMCLLKGKTNIAVVTENRKLARRLIALLARANVTVQDTAGWALATTSAATVLERWLQCIEQDFAYQPLLDLLKSPFFCDKKNADEHLKLVYHFEQDIVLHENIANNLQRFQTAIKNRAERLNSNNIAVAKDLLLLLEKIENSAKNLIKLFQKNTLTTPDIWIQYFIQSLETLGLYPQLANDIAGQRVQEELEKLSHALHTASPDMSWLDLRTWISATFEREQFKPQGTLNAVKIMNMQQAQYCQFDSLIIAGANMKSFPGSSTQHAFFNQSVRHELQLKNWHQKKQNDFSQFKQLLLSSDDILITWQAEQNGEWIKVSPWVSSLLDFSRQGFDQSLHDDELAANLHQLNPVTHRVNHLIETVKSVSQALPVISHAQIPVEFSASRHQRLIDCPYKFFAADILKLKPLEQISLELLKSEYGEKVHLILHAFHQQCPGLPTPFTKTLSKNNKKQALVHISDLSKQVFNTLAEDSIQHRGWFERWMNTAESYINWQIQRQQDWNIAKLEAMAEQRVNTNIKLMGRMDRIDEKNGQHAIIDYKTGNTAKQTDINLAENIQLTSYALLLENVSQVIYLKCDKGETKPAGILENDDLASLKTDILHRLKIITAALKPVNPSSTESVNTLPSPLPAWGDSKTCEYCDMGGLCRKQMWEILPVLNRSSEILFKYSS
ncbi:hypothetical protein MNBD_GAMMA07-428 [hydrothermal vent metagenome]|uniref:PD-(D/E)XK endonuclease-like domain-containing protein n=1 Tax=hydrothermal vent metagenome TaxID=652676 RepID=A0A3B0XHR1_9ZZZZ